MPRMARKPAGVQAKDIAEEAVPERGGVQSLERAFAILEEVAQHRDGVGLAELAKKVALHNSTTFHLVRTMVSAGYVRQDRASKRYHLGRMVFSLAANALNEIELVGTATPILEDLARATGETSHLAIRSGNDVVIAARVAGGGAFQLVDRAGATRPAHCTGLGKVLLAALPEEQLERVLTQPLRPYTAKSITDPERLREELRRVRDAGVAYDDAEFDLEVRCVAVPFHDFRGRIAGAIGISGPVWRLTVQRLQEAATQVRAASERLSRELGATGALAAE